MTWERRQEVTFALTLLVSVALGFALLEFAYRAYKAPDSQTRVNWRDMVASASTADPATGRPRFTPGASFGFLRFNRFGLRGPEPEIPARDGVLRIAFVGDSKVMAANYTEDRTLAAQTVRRLAARVPHCRFDYVAIAGPDYPLTLLARIWTEVAPVAKPDLAVLLAGSLGQLLVDGQGSLSMEPSDLRQPNWVDAVLSRSLLLQAVERQISFVGAALMPPRAAGRDKAALVEAYTRNLAPLVEAIAATPAIALGYRSRLRATQPPAVQARYSRKLRSELPGLAVPDAVALTEFNVRELARRADAAGWTFADPLQDMPYDDAYYLDDSHFSDAGLSFLSERIAAIIAPSLRDDCTIGLPRRE